MRLTSRDVRNDAMQHHPKLSGIGCIEQYLGMDSSLARGGAPFADLAVAWRDIDHDVTWTQNIPYHFCPPIEACRGVLARGRGARLGRSAIDVLIACEGKLDWLIVRQFEGRRPVL